MPLYRTSLLLIRAWVEKGSRKPLRAHIRATTDVSKGFESELTVVDVAATSAMVETWLEHVIAAGQLDEDPTISKETKSMPTWELKDLQDEAEDPTPTPGSTQSVQSAPATPNIDPTRRLSSRENASDHLAQQEAEEVNEEQTGQGAEPRLPGRLPGPGGS
jgi:hypothetical protein